MFTSTKSQKLCYLMNPSFTILLVFLKSEDAPKFENEFP